MLQGSAFFASSLLIIIYISTIFFIIFLLSNYTHSLSCVVSNTCHFHSDFPTLTTFFNITFLVFKLLSYSLVYQLWARIGIGLEEEDPPREEKLLKQISLLVACVLSFKPLIFIPLTFPLTNNINNPLSTILLPYNLSPKVPHFFSIFSVLTTLYVFLLLE